MINYCFPNCSLKNIGVTKNTKTAKCGLYYLILNSPFLVYTYQSYVQFFALKLLLPLNTNLLNYGFEENNLLSVLHSCC